MKGMVGFSERKPKNNLQLTVFDVKSQQHKIVFCIYRFGGIADTFRS